MDILNLDFEEDFTDQFPRAAASRGDCACGKQHVAIENEYICDEEREELLESARTGDWLILHDDCDYIEMVEVNSLQFVTDCECKKWKRYMNFIVDNRHEICRFLLKVDEKIQKAAQQERILNILKDTSLDNHSF